MMLSNSTTPTIRLSLPGMICTAMLLLVMVATAHSQDSPCNQGRAVWPRVDPRYDWLICVPEIGRQRKAIAQCAFGVPYEQFGEQVVPISTTPGKVSWIIAHDRCDTAPPGKPLPTELLLYRSLDGMLPPVESGERIGPREILSKTRLLAVGDWDNSGTVDLCCGVQLYGDTSGGNHTGYDVASVVVFWADSLGHYSIDDTTRLECDAQMWLGVQAALGTDRDNDGIDDLMIVNSLGLSNGATVEQACGRIYLGRDRKQWGRNGISRAADWRWWGRPPLTELCALDQDGDGNIDIVFYSNAHAGTGSIAVLYGRSSGLPDTNELQSIDLTITNGHASRLMDISNDGVPELVVHCGSLEQLAIFVGIRGQRLVDQFGPGLERLDTNRPPERWWTKPFARVWLPNRINDAWPGSTWDAVYDLGDANGDGYRDIWIHAQPFLLCYSSGPALDSLVDAMIDLSPFGVPTSLQTLGPLGGYPKAFAVGTTDGVIYARPDNQIPARSSNPRRWPDGTLGPRLGIEGGNDVAAVPAQFDVIPNPSSGDVELRWNRDVENGTLIISDAAGREVLRTHVDRTARSYMVPCTGLVPGIYFASVRGAHAAAMARMILR
ncbi:MAG TPA: T9SS type A sorting domain-containing protein [Candidatus Kapabacteria bacterium]|nr:T9SS type A sorting domain-containing protein [Candidatus Kapabacteria bacterium]